MNTLRVWLMLLRRETWEHRAIVLAPAIVAGLTVLLMLAGLLQGQGLSRDGAGLYLAQGLGLMSPDQREASLTVLLTGVVPMFALTMVIVILFYAVDALYSERRDRSILFWKSLPVTDTATVLAKLVTATMVIPLVTVVFVAITQVVTLLIATLMVWGAEGDAWSLVWVPAPLFSLWTLLGYFMLAAAVWCTPVIGWLLLASAWARKAPLLWATLPVVIAGQLELLAFGTTGIYGLVGDRVVGVFRVAFRPDIRTLMQVDGEGGVQAVATDRLLALIDLPGLLSAPGLWFGLAVALVLVVLAIFVRRYRDES